MHAPRVSKATALLLESIHANAHEVFNRHDIAVVTRSGALGEDELIETLNSLPGDGPTVLGLRSKTKCTAKVIDSCPRLTAIGAFCIGTDQIALDRATERGRAVFNAPFSNTRSVAELIVSLVVMLSRQIFPRSNAAHAGNWAKSATGAHEVRGKTIGIVGYGHIGSQVSVLAEALGMKVRYHDIVNKLPLGNAEAKASLVELLRESDFVTLHVPRSELTRWMIGEAELRAMKPGSYLLNYSRGDVVEIEALRKVIEEGHLAGAAIDVYPKEPRKAGEAFDTPLRGLENVILTPHIGGSTQEAQANIGTEVANVLSRYLLEGRTTGSVTLPHLEGPERRKGTSRILNVHRNVPGVLSAINHVLADSGLNIVSQNLATNEQVGVLIIDLARDVDEAQAEQLRAAIAAPDTSLRTRIV